MSFTAIKLETQSPFVLHVVQFMLDSLNMARYYESNTWAYALIKWSMCSAETLETGMQNPCFTSEGRADSGFQIFQMSIFNTGYWVREKDPHCCLDQELAWLNYLLLQDGKF